MAAERPSVKNEKQYEVRQDKWMSNPRAAKVASHNGAAEGGRSQRRSRDGQEVVTLAAATSP